MSSFKNRPTSEVRAGELIGVDLSHSRGTKKRNFGDTPQARFNKGPSRDQEGTIEGETSLTIGSPDEPKETGEREARPPQIERGKLPSYKEKKQPLKEAIRILHLKVLSWEGGSGPSINSTW